MKKIDRIDATIAVLATINFAYLGFGAISPWWRNMADYLKSVNLAGADVFAVLALTIVLLPLLAIQFVRKKNPENSILWKTDVILVFGWMITFAVGVLTHLPPI